MAPASAQYRLPLALIVVAAAAVIVALAAAGVTASDGAAVPMFWLALGGILLLGVYAVKGDLLTAVLAWFVTLIVLHEEFWRDSGLFRFALTVPRVFIVVLVMLFLAMWAVGRFRLRIGRWVGWSLIALVSFFAVSAAVTGFDTRSEVTVHYRLIGGYVFPLIAFVLLLHALRNSRDFRRLTVFFALIAVYLTYIGWCERLRLYAFVWPAFIADPNVGIHWGRVRGPFVMSPAMGLTLTFCFFSNLVLARQATLPRRWLLYSINLAMLPVLFWTKTRSVWMGFLLSAIIWVLYARRRTARAVGACVLAAVVLFVAVVNMENFLSTNREKGGLTDVGPILLRVGLAQMTMEMVADHPLTGVGFGHFRDFAPSYAHDPSSPYFAFSSSALEHNNLLSILAETGLIGLTLYVAVFVFLIRQSVQLYRKLPRSAPGIVNRDLVVLYWILLAAYVLDGTFRETSDNPFANCLFFGLSAIVAALNGMLSTAPLRATARLAPAVRPRPRALLVPRVTAWTPRRRGDAR